MTMIIMIILIMGKVNIGSSALALSRPRRTMVTAGCRSLSHHWGWISFSVYARALLDSTGSVFTGNIVKQMYLCVRKWICVIFLNQWAVFTKLCKCAVFVNLCICAVFASPMLCAHWIIGFGTAGQSSVVSWRTAFAFALRCIFNCSASVFALYLHLQCSVWVITSALGTIRLEGWGGGPCQPPTLGWVHNNMWTSMRVQVNKTQTLFEVMSTY